MNRNTHDSRLQPSTPGIVAFHILSSIFPEELVRMESPFNVEQHFDNPIGLELFQVRAARAAQMLMSRHGGCLLCDSVGLGKTFVALELARAALLQRRSVVVVVTSAIRPQWVSLLRRHLRRYFRADTNRPDGSVITLLTHAQLSRGAYPSRLIGTGGLLVIDEAHGFRTAGTRRYGAARALARSRDVCLMTATPVNNSLLDLYRLIRLWAPEHAYADVGVAHLKSFFKDLMSQSSSPLAFRRLLREVMIRRSRDEVRAELRNSVTRLRFPELAPPVAIAYDADNGATGTHAAVLRGIAALHFSAFGDGNAALLRFLLLKRLESSTAAVTTTVRRMRRFHAEFIAAADDNLLMRPADIRFFGADRDMDQLAMRRMTLRPATPHDRLDFLRSGAVHDVELLDAVLDALRLATPAADDKIRNLRELVCNTVGSQKVLVFTEFRETAEDLWRALVPIGGVAMVNGARAFLGRGLSSRRAVLERFSRRENSSRRFHARENVRILLATDVLSEGLNLQDCAHVVSYDLPWNPVRLMQRIGRIDRLGSPHTVIHTYNFIPDYRLERDLSILGRLRIKLHAIGLTMGYERPVLADPAAARAAVPGAEVVESEALHDDLEIRCGEWLRGGSHPEAPSAGSAQCLMVTVAETPSHDDQLIFITAHNGVVSAMSFHDGMSHDVDPVAMAALCIDASTRHHRCLDERMRNQLADALLRIESAILSKRLTPVATRLRSTLHRPAAALARGLMRALSSDPEAVHFGRSSACQHRLEAVIARLSSDLESLDAGELSVLAARMSTLGFGDLLEAVETLLAAHATPPPHPMTEPRIIAAIVLCRG